MQASTEGSPAALAGRKTSEKYDYNFSQNYEEKRLMTKVETQIKIIAIEMIKAQVFKNIKKNVALAIDHFDWLFTVVCAVVIKLINFN